MYLSICCAHVTTNNNALYDLYIRWRQQGGWGGVTVALPLVDAVSLVDKCRVSWIFVWPVNWTEICWPLYIDTHTHMCKQRCNTELFKPHLPKPCPEQGHSILKFIHHTGRECKQGQEGRIVTYLDAPVPELFTAEHGWSAAGDGGSVSRELGRKVAHIARYLPCLHDKRQQANLFTYRQQYHVTIILLTAQRTRQFVYRIHGYAGRFWSEYGPRTFRMYRKVCVERHARWRAA